MKRRRLSPERFKRIWALAEFISSHPGANRRQLAGRFAISERQLQNDLGVIRRDMALPLSRSKGYRFGHEGASTPALTLRDVHTLFQLLDRAARDPSIPKNELAATAERLVDAFPPPIRPLAFQTLATTSGSRQAPAAGLLASLTVALVKGQSVKLRFAPGAGMGYPMEPIVAPEVLLPYQDDWYLIGWCEQQRRVTMVSLDGLRAVMLEL